MAPGIEFARNLTLIALAALLALVISAIAGAGSAEAASPCAKWGDKESNEITVGHARKATLCLLNQERNRRGLPDLKRDRRLQRAAQRHNGQMQRRGCFQHECPGEGSLYKRLSKVGYLGSGLSRWSYGENIAWGEARLGTPRNVVGAWMRSSGHRANILSKSFRDIGIGYSKGTVRSRKANGAVFTTDFGLRVG